MSNIHLLRQYEPVVRYTQGEMFFPCAVDTFLTQCSLWRNAPNGDAECLITQGELTPQKLVTCADVPPGHTLFLRYVEQPIEGLEYQRFRRERPAFSAAGRLARVGLGSRILDSGFDLSLLVRGRVPGGTAAAAFRQYQTLRQRDPRYVYYGRVLRTGGYIVLHYLYFYVMNNWRSRFYGVNDHEGDWEQVFVYLSDEDDPQPLWVAYAAHDEHGDDLRRHWDDPQLDIIDGTHPVVYAGAGSHASYFEAGEYLTQFRLQLLEPIRNGAQHLRQFWTEQLQQGSYEDARLEAQVDDLFNIPFIDYARGDGQSIGHGQPQQWSALLIDDTTDWVEGYRGLWGLDTRDPFGGERAPAGPRYNRDGTIRASWHNPLGWSGVDKVAPPQYAAEQLRERITDLHAELSDVHAQIAAQRDELRLLDLEVRALWIAEYMDELHHLRDDALDEREADLNALHERAADLADTLEAARDYLQRVQQGDYGDPRGHLSHVRRPMEALPRLNRILEFWAALSTGLLFLLFALSIVVLPGNWFVRAGIIVAVFIFIESTLRGRLADLLLNVTLLLAVISVGVLLVEFIWLVLLLALLALAWLILSENLRELRERD